MTCLIINIFFFKHKIFTSKINFLILLLILFQIFQVIGNILGKANFADFENYKDFFIKNLQRNDIEVIYSIGKGEEKILGFVLEKNCFKKN